MYGNVQSYTVCGLCIKFFGNYNNSLATQENTTRLSFSHMWTFYDRMAAVSVNLQSTSIIEKLISLLVDKKVRKNPLKLPKRSN